MEMETVEDFFNCHGNRNKIVLIHQINSINGKHNYKRNNIYIALINTFRAPKIALKWPLIDPFTHTLAYMWSLIGLTSKFAFLVQMDSSLSQFTCI